MTGHIVGGWVYVAAAWLISLGLFSGYVIAVNVQLARARRGTRP